MGRRPNLPRHDALPTRWGKPRGFPGFPVPPAWRRPYPVRTSSSERPRGLKLGSCDPSPALERQQREPVGAVAPERLPAAARAPPPPVALVQDPVALPVEGLRASLDKLLEACPRDL